MGIMPTTRGWLVCLSAVAWMLVAMVNHTLFALLLAWCCIGLAAASLICALLSTRGIHVERGVVLNGTSGNLLPLPLKVRNGRRRRRQPLVIREQLPFSVEKCLTYMVAPLKPREEMVLERQTLAIRRGEYKLSAITVCGGDPAGLFRREWVVQLPAALVIYPPVEELMELELQERETYHPNSERPISIAGASQDFYGIREYQPRDGIHSIHWKSSAKYHKFMVKEYERSTMLTVAVVLHVPKAFATKKEEDAFEALVVRAASICSHCASLHCTLAFVAGGRVPVLLRPKEAKEALPEIMYHLAVVAPGPFETRPLFDEITTTLPREAYIFHLPEALASQS